MDLKILETTKKKYDTENLPLKERNKKKKYSSFEDDNDATSNSDDNDKNNVDDSTNVFSYQNTEGYRHRNLGTSGDENRSPSPVEANEKTQLSPQLAKRYNTLN